MARETASPLRICGVHFGTPHEPHGPCPGTAPEYMSERVLTSAEAAAITARLLNGGQR